MTPRKFLRQPESVRRRHAPRLLADLEQRLHSGSGVTPNEIVTLSRLLAGEDWLDDACRTALGSLVEAARSEAARSDARRAEAPWSEAARSEAARSDARRAEAPWSEAARGGERRAPPSELIRRVNHARHEILRATGREPADWDLGEPKSASPDREAIATFPVALFGESIRSPYNVGSMIRSAAAFGARECLFSPDSANPEHSRARRSAMGADRSVSVRRATLDEVSSGEMPLFAVESGGVAISEFTFPDRGIALFGHEELGLSHDALACAAASRGIVSIPLYGAKQSLNVAATAAIVLSWWVARLGVCRTYGQN